MVIRTWMDCETFGMNPKVNPLATVYMSLYTENGTFIDEINLKVVPDSMEGMVPDLETEKIHGIKWEDHIKDPETITYSQAREKIEKFLLPHKIPKAKKSFMPAGQNVVFDINYLRNTIFDMESWEKLFHYRYLDTLVLLTFLQDLELVPSDLGNLASMIDYYQLKTGEFHDARSDTKMTVQVYQKMVESIGGLKKSGILSSSAADLLKAVED